jgi:hypothetical protein
MCARKETDVRESPNDSTFPGGEGQGSRGETRHPFYNESPVSSLPERGVFNPLKIINYVAVVRRRTITTSVRRLSAKLVRGQRNEFPRPLISVVATFSSSSSSIVLTKLSGPRSRPPTSQKIW